MLSHPDLRILSHPDLSIELILVSRRQLIHGRLSGNQVEFHPPWSIDPLKFVEQCSRCDACIDSCPQQILKRNNQGYPVVDFSTSGCTFCAACAESCKTGSLSLMAFIGDYPWSVKAQITESCINYSGIVCRICADTCISSAISFRINSGAAVIPEIDLDACTGCGECYRHCPKKAIKVIPI